MTRRFLAYLGLLLASAACTSSRPSEFINITFKPSKAGATYRTWSFDLERCVDTGDSRADDAALRELLLTEIEAALTDDGYVHRSKGQVDFRVWYELRVVSGDAYRWHAESARGKIFILDTASGELVWRGERKAALSQSATPEEREQRVRAFARELLQYTKKL